MILVTGATGNISGHVIRQLADKGVKVRAFVRDAKKGAGLKGPNVDVVQGDLGKTETIEKAMAGCEKLFLLTVASANMAEQEMNALKAAKKCGLKHIVKLSAFGAATEHKSLLAKAQGYCEVNVRKIGVPYTIIRPHAFMSNFLMFAGSIKSQGAFYAPMKQGKIAAVDPADIAAVAVGVLTGKGHSSKAYNITGPEALSYGEYAEKLSAAVGKAIKYVDVPAADAKKAMLGMGMSEWLAQGLLDLYDDWANNKADKVTDVVKEVGGKDPTTFDDWAQQNAAAFK